MLVKLTNISRLRKQLLMMVVDSILLIAILFLSFYIRIGNFNWIEDELLFVILFSPLVALPVFAIFGLYNTILRYISFKFIWSITGAVTLYALIWGIFGFMAAIEGIPRSVIIINWLFLMITIIGSRVIAKWIVIELIIDSSSRSKNVLIYGAGTAGRQLLVGLLQENDYKPVALIDDDLQIQGQLINGLKIFPNKSIEKLIKKFDISEIFLAIPSLSRLRRFDILRKIELFPVTVRSLPSMSELARGEVQVQDLKKVNIEELLGRKIATPNQNLLKINITNKVVLVTGAGGSIGSELCRQVSLLKPKKLILFEVSEASLYHIKQELDHNESFKFECVPILGSIRDKNRLEDVLSFFSVQTIYHAAAYKHVPLVEFNQSEGVLNNAIGTMIVAKAAISQKVETFVLISTDKAVRPANTMGAAKRVAELILQAFAVDSETCFTMVRFGNVLDSSGSVIPLFNSQIKKGGPITLTDKSIVRYFMTIPEAVELVIQAGSMGKGGEVFVLDMGEPIKIYDLAVKMIKKSGLEVKDKNNPKGDIEIKIIGLRPGEKLYEELLVGENVISTEHNLIMKAEESMIEWALLGPILLQLQEACFNSNHSQIRELLIQIVPEFKPQSEIVDFLYDD
jgi:FlaA1/EpsC-like NDP-sugar epimerase